MLGRTSALVAAAFVAVAAADEDALSMEALSADDACLVEGGQNCSTTLLQVRAKAQMRDGGARCNQDTSGTCFLWAKCNSWRGPTRCSGGKCLCKEGYCADAAGTCSQEVMQRSLGQPLQAACLTETPGTCFGGHCNFWRGATECVSFKCHCRPGYCVDRLGGCFKNMGIIKAPVVPVNQAKPTFPGAPVKVALAISGGGSRSHAAGLGYYRALRDLGLISGLDAISSVSGGTWASAILMFAPQGLDALLGPATDPQQLSLAALDATPAPHGAVLMTPTSQVATNLKTSGLPFGLLWVGTVAKAFLEPFGLNRFDAFMAESQEAVEQIKKLNPQYQDALFQVPQPGRAKTLVMGCTLEAPNQYIATDANTVSLQVAPDFSGSPFYPDNQRLDYTSNILGKPSLNDVLVGGGLLATFAFGASAPTSPQGQFGGKAVEMAAPVRPLALARAVGMSSAAFGKVFSALPGMGDFVNPSVPEWPVESPQQPGPQKAINFQVGDGNDIENTGLLAMIQRRATSIVSLINTDKRLQMDVDVCAGGYKPTGHEITTQFSNFFGYAAAHDQIFASSEYLPILCELQSLKKAGKAQVVRKTLAVQRNAWWGIESGWSVDILFCLLDQASEFEHSLPADTQHALQTGLIGGLEGFPTMKTTYQNGVDLTQYTARQINLLAAQAEWAVQQNSQLFKEVLR